MFLFFNLLASSEGGVGRNERDDGMGERGLFLYYIGVKRHRIPSLSTSGVRSLRQIEYSVQLHRSRVATGGNGDMKKSLPDERD